MQLPPAMQLHTVPSYLEYWICLHKEKLIQWNEMKWTILFSKIYINLQQFQVLPEQKKTYKLPNIKDEESKIDG